MLSMPGGNTGRLDDIATLRSKRSEAQRHQIVKESAEADVRYS